MPGSLEPSFDTFPIMTTIRWKNAFVNTCCESFSEVMRKGPADRPSLDTFSTMNTIRPQIVNVKSWSLLVDLPGQLPSQHGQPVPSRVLILRHDLGRSVTGITLQLLQRCPGLPDAGERSVPQPVEREVVQRVIGVLGVPFFAGTVKRVP